MSVPVIIRPAAELDLQAAFDWSESIEPGLGSRFLVHVATVVETLEAHPFAFPVFHRESRRAVIPHSPYVVFHVAAESRVLVIACFSGHRDPRRIRRTLRRREGT